MRHAKSSWSDPTLKDFDRPLNERGDIDAPRMGEYLKELGLIPDQMIGSSALRAKQTLLKVCKELSLDSKNITWDEDLYFRGTLSYIHALKRVRAESSVAIVTGHFPMVSDVVSALTGKEFQKHFSTAGIACLEANIESWDELEEGICEMKWFVRPKDLK